MECRQAGAIQQLVRMLSSGDESSLTAAAVWAILQLAGDCPENKKVRLPPCTPHKKLGKCRHPFGNRQLHTSGVFVVAGIGVSILESKFMQAGE